ncbi:hypothetical protein EK21DRAFT_65450 [Setomelanomma holmii]|uniref:Uncharacterized protein n=1 Tax=Setomelanomma holmii TaxID=210430 RepID=A0A9P4HAA3_9PLEO|nr:hypothetical protein EK21DRAFT_65450 [Setomelanomma holmii]
MATRTASFTSPICPSSAQAALALAIVRSKPPEVAIRDYALHLREHYKPGQSSVDPEDHGHYLDLVGYWQDQCQRAQEECDRLRSINVRLERSNHQLAQRTNVDTDERPNTATSPKRKAPASPSRSPKRSRASQPNEVEQSAAERQSGIDHDYDFLDSLGDDGEALTEALYTTHQLCRAFAPNAEVLCHSLVRTASSLTKIIHSVAHSYEALSRQGRRIPGAQSLGEDRSDFAQALTVFARSFMSILVGTTKMMDLGQDDRLPSLIVCGLANMFRTVLVAIGTSARQTAESSARSQVSSKNGKARASVTPKESLPARSLAHLLTGLLGLLDKANVIHQQIFDAFVFLLLERVSTRLYYCTFGRYKGASIETDLVPPPEVTDVKGKTEQELQSLAIHLEVKALVLILERAMGLAPHHMNPISAHSKSKSPNRMGRTLSMKSLPSAPKTRLSSVAKDRLQRTLVSCMYGSKADDEFLDVLTKPMPAMRIGTPSNVAKIEDKDVEQWYKEEIWRLVGWDILARESGW